MSELSFSEKLELMELAELLTRGYTTTRLSSFEENYKAILKLVTEGGDQAIFTNCTLSTLKDETDKDTRSCLFHKLWTKAAGKEGYDKQEWLTLGLMVNGF